MPMISTNCGICGKPADPIDDELTGGIWAPTTCAECARRRLLEDGGLVVQLLQKPKGALFEFGEVQIRPGALHVLTESSQHFWPFLVRHARGDTGVFTSKQPDRAGKAYLNSSGNVVSEYRTGRNRRLWVITSPGKVTVLMTPGEF